MIAVKLSFVDGFVLLVILCVQNRSYLLLSGFREKLIDYRLLSLKLVDPGSIIFATKEGPLYNQRHFVLLTHSASSMATLLGHHIRNTLEIARNLVDDKLRKY